MLDINTIVTTNYTENIHYFEEYHPVVFDKIISLQNAIDNGYYQEKYELIYENDTFDVLEKSSKKLLYDAKSLNHAQLAAKSLNYKTDNNLFETFHKRFISQDALKSYEQKDDFMDHLSGFAPILYYIQEHSKESDMMQEIDKFIFFGIGLGLHIATIHKKISSKTYLLIEDDLELFRLSLFSTNYKNIAPNSKLIFCIFEDEERFSSIANQFLAIDYHYNYYLKYFHMLSHSDDKQLQMHQLITSQPHLTFYYHTMLKHYTRPIEYLFSDYRFLNSSFTFDNKHLRDKPFLLLAAGPSLEKNAKWLKENHQKFVIVAVSAVLAFLQKESISPDIIIQLDGHLDSIRHFEKLDSLEFIKNSIYIFSDKVPLTIISMLQKDRVFLFENSTKYKNNSFRPTAFCVGSISFETLLRLKIKKIYLLGLDLAIDEKTGMTHSSTHHNPRVISIEESLESSDTLEYKTNLKEIPGNHSKSVLTTQHFLASVEYINYFVKSLKQPQQTIINLSDGAKFINTISKECEDIEPTESLSKENITKNIYKVSIKNSSTSLSSSELKSLRKKLLNAKEIKRVLLLHLEEKIVSNSKYLESLKELSETITDEQSIEEYELSRVIDTYFKYILPHIFNFITKKTTNNEDISKIRELLLAHLLKIVDFYSAQLKHIE